MVRLIQIKMLLLFTTLIIGCVEGEAEEGKSECQVGSEGCECTEGGGCDVGLNLCGHD